MDACYACGWHGSKGAGQMLHRISEWPCVELALQLDSWGSDGGCCRAAADSEAGRCCEGENHTLARNRVDVCGLLKDKAMVAAGPPRTAAHMATAWAHPKLWPQGQTIQFACAWQIAYTANEICPSVTTLAISRRRTQLSSRMSSIICCGCWPCPQVQPVVKAQLRAQLRATEDRSP
eukprot:jgi/Ulvmu1/486/UM001_0494.1